MQLLKFALALFASQNAAAHTIFTTLFVNDVSQGDGVCVRMNMTPENSTNPVQNLASNDMACGFDGEVGVARICPVSRGAKLSFLWREWADASHPGSIDISHKGPCAVYMKAVSSAVNDPGYGTGWFKIWELGYDNVSAQWCTEKLIQDNGFLSIDIPGDLAGGYYLVRPELLALHQADKTPPDPQFYVGCAQIFLQTNGSAVPQDTVRIPGYVDAGDPSVNFNIYDPVWPYPMPGPAPYVDGIQRVTGEKIMVQLEGLVPTGCVVENANWCGIELDSYDSEGGCWNASSACWNQATACYNSAPPTGDKGCRLWESQCSEIQAACNAGIFTGPPNRGVSLDLPSTSTYAIPPAATSNEASAQYMYSARSTLLKVARAATTVTDSFPLILDSSASNPKNFPFPASNDASCGAFASRVCPDSECCSKWGWCGTTGAYCGDECQFGFGSCWAQAP